MHTREAEARFLLQGAMTYRAGERLIRMTVGDFICLLDIYDEAGVPAAERRLPDAGVSDAGVARWLELAPATGSASSFD